MDAEVKKTITDHVDLGGSMKSCLGEVAITLVINKFIDNPINNETASKMLVCVANSDILTSLDVRYTMIFCGEEVGRSKNNSCPYELNGREVFLIDKFLHSVEKKIMGSKELMEEWGKLTGISSKFKQS